MASKSSHMLPGELGPPLNKSESFTLSELPPHLAAALTLFDDDGARMDGACCRRVGPTSIRLTSPAGDGAVTIGEIAEGAKLLKRTKAKVCAARVFLALRR